MDKKVVEYIEMQLKQQKAMLKIFHSGKENMYHVGRLVELKKIMELINGVDQQG